MGKVVIKAKELAKLDPMQPENAFCLLLKEKGAPFSEGLLPIADPSFEWKFDERPNGDVKVQWRKVDAEAEESQPE